MDEMPTGAQKRVTSDQRSAVLCLVPSDLAPMLLDPLRRHYAESGIEVIEERRSRERRSGRERRRADKGPPEGTTERRRIRNEGGRRVGERRAELIAVDPPVELPRKARPYADRIAFCERVPIGAERAEDDDTARLVTRIQANGREAFAELYERYFDRIYAYLRVMLKDSHEAEDAAQQVFIDVFEGLPRYERRRQPFRAWLFRIARNEAVSHLRRSKRLEVEDPETIERHRSSLVAEDEPEIRVDWISDRDLMVLVERLPETQRQVLTLRYLLGLSNKEIASVLDTTPMAVGQLHYRARSYLAERLRALGSADTRRRTRRSPMLIRLRRMPILGARRNVHFPPPRSARFAATSRRGRKY